MDPDAVVLQVDEETGKRETECNDEKMLSDFISDGAVLTFDDFLQNYNLRVSHLDLFSTYSNFLRQAFLWQMDEKPEDGSDFIVTGDKEQLQPKEEEEKAKEPEKEDTNGANKDSAIDVDDDIMEVSPHANGSGDNKRPAEEGTESAAKKARSVTFYIQSVNWY